jgi:hypothetical protein
VAEHVAAALADPDDAVLPILSAIRRLLQQMDDAVRSLRLMADYLERNPNALITGRSDNRR